MTSFRKTKAYENVLDKLKNYIKENELQPGDRLPSERELVDQLQVSRSSIREGLRAIELLGLIETKTGEGTFLRSYQSYRTLSLLAMFIFQDPNTKIDILEVKRLIEKEALKMAFASDRLGVVEQWEEIAQVKNGQTISKHRAFYQVVFRSAKNDLLEKMWRLMDEFVETFHVQQYSDRFYLKVKNVFVQDHYQEIEKIFETAEG